MGNIVLNNDTSQNLWTYSFQMDKELGNTIELNTANTFLDKNIKITVIEPEQTNASGFSLNISEVFGNSEVTIGSTNSNGYYPITANNLSIKGTVNASTAGWFSTSGIQTDSDVDNASIGKIAAGSYSASIGSHSISTIPVVQGKLSGTITNIGTTTKPSGTDGTDYWTITPSGEVTTTGISTASGKATIDTTGYIPVGNKSSSSDTKNIVPSINNGTVRYIPKAAISGSCTNATATVTVAPGDVTISENTSSVTGKTRLALTPVTTTSGINKYYVTIRANAAANTTGTTSSISGSGSATVSTAGYAPATLTGSISVSGTATGKTSSKDSDIYYVPIPSASFANSATSGVTYTDISSNGPVLVSGDYLYINAGYTENQKISLAQLVPNDATITGVNYKSDSMLQTASAYDKNGILFTGSIETKSNNDIILDTSGTTPMVKGPAGYYPDAISKDIGKAAGSTTCSGGALTWTNGNATIVDSSITGIAIKISRAKVTATSKITTAGYTSTNTSFSTDSIAKAETTKYITGVTLVNGNEFDVTVPNGDSETVTFHFSVADGNTTIT